MISKTALFYSALLPLFAGSIGSYTGPHTGPHPIPPTSKYYGYCDYSNADFYNGWGWNPVTKTSCPPRD